MSGEALGKLDQWLTNIANDKSDQPKANKIAANRPADFVDACYPAVAGPRVGVIRQVTDQALCANPT
jgi:Tannase-like family of unknown function (DUF6351)